MGGFKAANLNLLNVRFYPETGSGLGDKLNDCYRQFSELIENNGLAKEHTVKQSIFFAASSLPEYLQNKQKLFSCASLFFPYLPPTSIISQAPDRESVVLELTLLEGVHPGELVTKETQGARWSVFSRGITRLVFAAGLNTEGNYDDILQQSTNSFELAEEILEAEGMNFSNVVRQWNYIAQITKGIEVDSKSSQHYQIFNDVRSKYYETADFENGYPAATGIGMDWGGIIIDFVAGNLGAMQSVGIKSPVQFDAYTYSKKVLAENCTMSDFCRTTPKFERARLVDVCGAKWIFISGTAAILGQVSDHQNSVEDQTEMTIDNIRQLISAENIRRFGIEAATDPAITYLRVYVKYKADFEVVKQICRKHFTTIPLSFVVADVCRPELLLEIEGHALLH